MADPLLEVRGVVKHYHGLRPLRVKSLVVHSGERVALAGFDATTAEILVNLLNGAIVPDEGEVVAFGRRTTDIATDTEWFAALDRFGIVTSRATLLEGLSLAQNMALPFTLDIDSLSDEVRRRVEGLARESGLDVSHLARPAGEATPDEKVRVHLARALATGPQVLLLEHPTVTLPRGAVTGFASTVRTVTEARELALLVVTEDDEFATRVADRAWRLEPRTGELVDGRGWRRWFGG